MNSRTLTGLLGLYKESATKPKGLPLGFEKEFADGRKFRLCKAGEALTAGLACRNADVVSNHVDIDIAAASIGAKEVTVTLGATEATANQYEDGYLVERDSGRIHKIKKHPAADGDETLELELYDALETAIAGTEKVDLIKNVWKDVMIAETDQEDKGICSPLIDITDEYYFWGQVSGPGTGQADETFSKGAVLTFGTGDAGQLEVVDAVAEPIIAEALEAADTADDFVAVFWRFE